MQRVALFLFFLLLASSPAQSLQAQNTFQEDILPTSAGDLTITFIGHGTLMFTFGEKVIHLDPVRREADYSSLTTTATTWTPKPWRSS